MDRKTSMFMISRVGEMRNPPLPPPEPSLMSKLPRGTLSDFLRYFKPTSFQKTNDIQEPHKERQESPKTMATPILQVH